VRRLYVDTEAWIALLWRRDQVHPLVAEHFRALLRRNNDLLVTSDPVIGETVTRLRYDSGSSAVLAFSSLLEQAVALVVSR
jgi:predicted nucleic acid-binding protein